MGKKEKPLDVILYEEEKQFRFLCSNLFNVVFQLVTEWHLLRVET
jgi:hypothetical protein